MTEEYITQVSEEIEGRVTKKLSQDFIRTESRILVALSNFDEFILNPQVRTCTGTVPGTSRNNDFEKRERTGDRSQNDPYPEVELSVRQVSNSTDSDQEETSHSGQLKDLAEEPRNPVLYFSCNLSTLVAWNSKPPLLVLVFAVEFVGDYFFGLRAFGAHSNVCNWEIWWRISEVLIKTFHWKHSCLLFEFQNFFHNIGFQSYFSKSKVWMRWLEFPAYLQLAEKMGCPAT